MLSPNTTCSLMHSLYADWMSLNVMFHTCCSRGGGGKQGGRGGSLCATSDSNKHTSVDDGLYPGNHLMDVGAVLELLSKDLHFGGAS